MKFFGFMNENGKLNKLQAASVKWKVNAGHPQKLSTLRSEKGFTLAEVLITLVIIGIIGALTVPSLIQRTQKQEYVSALKKAYSTLSNATQAIIAEEGSPKSSCETCDDGWAYDIDNVYNLYKTKLNILKDCGSEAGCWYSGTTKNLDGSRNGEWYTAGYARRFVLSDGIAVMIDFSSDECSRNYAGSDKGCASIWVDVNGGKKPNIIGRDVFYLNLQENGLYPAGCTNNMTDYCNTEKGWHNGHGCACRVLRENAMNY